MILSFIITFKIEDDRLYQQRWASSLKADRQQFPNLPDPILYFSRRHGGDWGVWVMVYPLNEKTKQTFLQQWHSGQVKTVEYIECIDPTIKKRWKTWNSNIHYVVKDPCFQLTRQERFKDSFIVFGSDNYLKIVERACQNSLLKKMEKKEPYYDNYWAINEKHNLLFSVNGFY